MSRRMLLLAGMVCVAVGRVGAQVCPAPLRQPPAVRLTAAITGCDYLGALAEPAHVSGTSNCAAIAGAVSGDTTSRIHLLSRMLADSLRPVFAHHFGFLAWAATPDTTAWSATVVVSQPHRGADGTLQVVLRSPAGLETASDPLDFERFAAIAQLFREPRTPQSLAVVTGRWAALARALLEDNQGFNRSRLVRSVFRAIPIAALTPAEATPLVQGQSVEALLPVRDTDIRVKRPDRPTFEWQVGKVVRGQPPDEDEGVFELGACSGTQRYRCRMTRLRYGAATFEGTSVAQFFDGTTRLHAPIGLHVVDYRPAANVCAPRGDIPR